MTDTEGEDAAAPPSPNVSALVEAIDVRARQAGAEGAAGLLRGSLGSVSELLTAIQTRLDGVEELLGARSEPSDALAQQVQAGLDAFNTRLGRLEEAFIQAVEDSGASTQTVVDQVRDAVLASMRDIPVGQPEPATDFGPLAERLEAIQDMLSELAPTRAEPDLAAPLEAAMGPLVGRLDRLERSVTAMADTVEAGAARGREDDGREDEVQATDRGRLDELAEELRSASAGQADAISRLAAGIEEAGASLASVQAGLGAVEHGLSRLADEMQAVVAAGRASAESGAGASDAAASVAEGLAQRVIEATRREAELLTQRVAALAVGVEASRALLEQHVEETENSIGRKATEATRKLAADFGLRARGGRSRDRDPRELGSGHGRSS